MLHEVSQVRNTQCCGQDELSQGKRKTTTRCAEQFLHNTHCTERQQPHSPMLCQTNLHSSDCVDQKTAHVWTQLERILETMKQSLKHHESPPENTRTTHVNLRTLLRRRVPCALRRFKHLRWAINSCLTAVSPCLSLHSTLLAWQALVCDLWTVTCGVLLLWNVLCFTNLCALSARQSTRRAFSSIFYLVHSTVPRRWAASADSTRFACSWPHAKPASFSRLLLLLQHFIMNMETESAALATPVFVSFTCVK